MMELFVLTEMTKNYKPWEGKSLAHLRLLNLKSAILNESPDEEDDGAANEAKKKGDG